MTVPATTRRAGPFTGNGATTSFPFAFKVFTTADIQFTTADADGLETLRVLGSDYSVTLNPDQDASPGGSVTYPISGTPLPVGHTAAVTGAVEYTQELDLPGGGSFSPTALENALDRTTMQVQQLVEEVGRSLTLPVTAAGASTELPVPEAGKVIAWNSDGTGLVNIDSGDLASVVVAGSSYTDVFSGTGAQTAFTLTADPGSVNALDVAISGVSQVNGVDFTASGTTLTFTSAPPSGTGNVVVRYVAALPEDGALGALADTSRGTSLIGWLRAATGAVSTTLSRWLGAQDLNIFEFLTVAQITDVQAYTFALDLSTPVQAAINAAWTSGKKLRFPPGGYKVNSLFISETGAEAARILDIEGAGAGNPFAAGVNSGTIWKGTINDPVFSVYTAAVSTSTGTLRIKGITFVGNSSTTPVVFLKSFYGTSEFSHNVVRQDGIGNGMEVQVMATGSIHDCYFLNKDLVTFGLGASRVGVGLWINQQYDAGLQTVYKCSSRGWLTPFIVGATSGTTYTYNAAIYDCECSVSYNGIRLTALARATRVDNVYCEGGEGGVAIQDDGDYNTVSRCYTFSGYSVHLKSTSFTYGNVYDSNTFTAGTAANQVLVDITSSSSNGGPGKTLTNNQLSFGGSGGSIAGVIGLRINGTDPRIHMAGNSYFPRGAWTGGAGTTKVSDLSASGDGTSGSGVFGLRMVQSLDSNRELPALMRGAVNLAVDSTTITSAPSGVLTLGEGSVFTVTLGSATNITSIVAPNLADKTFSLHVTNNNATFVQGTTIKMAGSANYTPPGTGAWLTFQVKPGGVVWETTARAVY